jgi:hypothetical protein
MNVSILTPTYNREKFLPLAIQNIKLFEGDQSQWEWCILDDGDERYIRDPEFVRKMIHPVKLNYKFKRGLNQSIGQKRNILSKMATHDILINMDDDDIYFPSYIKHTTSVLFENFPKGNGLVGSNQMLFIYPHLNFRCTGIRCGSKRQIHEGTMCFHKKYIRSMGGFSRNSKGEGARLIDGSENRCQNIEIYKQMICTGHEGNTICKKQFADKTLPLTSNLQDVIYDLPQFKILEQISRHMYHPCPLKPDDDETMLEHINRLNDDDSKLTKI